MSDPLEHRLESIEARLDALERATAAGARRPQPFTPLPPVVEKTARRAPAPPRVRGPARTPRPAAAREAPAPAPARAPRPAVDWERFFGMAVLGRIGVGAVLLAAGYFAQLLYREISDVLKVCAIYGLSGAFFAAGHFARTRTAKRYVALLWGGATAAAYIAGAAAHMRYGLVGWIPALGMLLAASALGQALARKLGHETLASMALAGAFAAPLLIDSPLDARTFLLVYLLTLHTWSAWVDRAWGWRSARLVGVAGTALVAGAWFVEAGMSASTFLHVHLYVLGVGAPELVSAWRRERLTPMRQYVLPCVLAHAIVLLLAMSWNPEARTVFLPGMTLIVAATWLGIVAALRTRRPAKAVEPFLVALTHVAGIALALGAYVWPNAIAVVPGDVPPIVRVLCLAGVVAFFLLLQKRLRVGDVPAAAATGLAAWTALIRMSDRDGQALGVALLAAAMCAAVLTQARTFGVRGFVAWCGAVTLAVALGRHGGWDRAAVATAIVGAAAWFTAVRAWSRHTRSPPLALHAETGLLVVAGWWTLATMTKFTPWRLVETALLDPLTLAGIATAAAAACAAARSRSDPGRRPFPRLWAACAAVLLLAGHRETLTAVQGLARPMRDALHVLYLSVGGAALLAIGRRVGSRGAARCGLALALAALVKAHFDWTVTGLAGWPVLELLAPVAVLAFGLWAAGRRDRLAGKAAIAGLGLAALTWAVYWSAGRLPADPAVLNARFATALAVLAALVFAARAGRPREADGRAPTSVLLIALPLGFLAGYAELWGLVKGLEGSWPNVLVSVYATLFAAGTLIGGFRRGDSRLRYAALGIFALVVMKVGIHDLSRATLPLRILVTGILGLVLLAAAFAYARRSEPEENDGGAPSPSPAPPELPTPPPLAP